MWIVQYHCVLGSTSRSHITIVVCLALVYTQLGRLCAVIHAGHIYMPLFELYTTTPSHFHLQSVYLQWKSVHTDCAAWSVLVAARSLRISSISLLSFARRFWNHVMTCAFERFSISESSSLSCGERYFW